MITDKPRLGRRRAGMAESHGRSAVAGAFLNGDVPFGDNQGQDAQRSSRIRQRQMREVTEGAAVREVIGGVIGGKRGRLERERSGNQQQYRQSPYIMAVKLHKRLNYTSNHAKAARGVDRQRTDNPSVSEGVAVKLEIPDDQSGRCGRTFPIEKYPAREICA